MASPLASFSHGVASGDPYADSVILWTRVTPADPQASQNLEVSWEASTRADFATGSVVDSGVFNTSAARDWTVKVEADGLKADTTYYYRFRIGDQLSAVGQTKTLPVGSDPVRLAVFSCANFTASEQFAAYGRAAAVNTVNPYDALVHLGDYIYEYGPGGYGAAEDAAENRGFLPNREITSLDDYRQRYAQYHTDLNLQALRASAPLIAIWDDHETANDSWSGGAENHQSDTEGPWQVRRDAAMRAYYEWLPIREASLRDGVDQGNAETPLSQGYRSFAFGDVLDLHVLETRLTARDQPLDYPNAAAVQARIGAILNNPTEVATYASKLKVAAPTSAESAAAFGAALAPLVTQELVFATVQKAWGDAERDLIGDTQMAWLQQQMASSDANWQVLGQQVLMQSMAVPAELLLNAGNPALLDKYAAPLQKLATGTPFSALTSDEQALFAEAGKIPYNLDAWDGYGVERETILQTALQLNKRLISLAGDTHNAWAGVLDTMSSPSTPGAKPAGTVAGVEFATPGVTSPGLEKYLPGADAYLRAKYPAIDGLDGLFSGYVNGLKYADLNRRGFLDLTVTPESATGTYVFLDGSAAANNQAIWASEAVTATANYTLAVGEEANTRIDWAANWKELDLVMGQAVDNNNNLIDLNPGAYAAVPRRGVQLADVVVQGSAGSDQIFAGIGSLIEAAAGSDALFNTESQGNNLLVGGRGNDSFYLTGNADRVIGGTLLNKGSGLGRVDGDRDTFYLEDLESSSAPVAVDKALRVQDFEIGIDALAMDGITVQTATKEQWQTAKATLKSAGILINAAPLQSADLTDQKLSLIPGVTTVVNLAQFATDFDGDALQVQVLSGPSWFSAKGASLTIQTPEDFTADQLAALSVELGISDGLAVTAFTPQLLLGTRPPSAGKDQSVLGFTDAEGKSQTYTIQKFGGEFSDAKPAQLITTDAVIDRTRNDYQQLISSNNVELAKRSLDFDVDVSSGAGPSATVNVDLAALIDNVDDDARRGRRMVYYAISADGSLSQLTYNPRQRGGARFYDLDNNGLADFLSLNLADGGFGDKDGLVNGTIVDPSAPGSVELNPVLTRLDAQTLTVGDPTKTTAPAGLLLKASLTSRNSTANQIGYVILEANEVADAATLLSNLTTLRSRAQILFTSLESNDVVTHASTQLSRELLLVNNQSVRFFQVTDASLEDLTSVNDNRLQFFNIGDLNQTAQSVSLTSTAGVRFTLELLSGDQGLNALIGQEQGLAPVLDFTAFTNGQRLVGTLVQGREADLDSVTGFYRVLDTQGTVRDQLGNLVRPGDIGYRDAALRSQNRVDALSGMSVGDNQTGSRRVEVSETGYLAPFMQVQNNSFFAFAAANADGYAHFKVLGTNLFGAEDLLGGGDRDHDDHVFGFTFTQIVNPVA